MKNIFLMSLVTLLGITGCTENNRRVPSGESVECERLKYLFNNLEEENIKTVFFFAEDSNELIDEATFKEFKGMILHLAGCCTCKPHPLAKEWIEYNRLECIWEHLEKENIQKIDFYNNILSSDFDSPKDWHPWAEITDSQRIKEVLKLFCKALKKEKNRFDNEEIIAGDIDRMQIITDKHKFIIPISYYREAVRGVGWTSYELREQLKEWGFPGPK